MGPHMPHLNASVDTPTKVNKLLNTDVCIPVVPHKAVAEVSRIGHYRRD